MTTHKSKLAGFIIDCENADPISAAQFWSQALGMPMQKLPGEEGEKYARLQDKQHGLHVEVQSVTHQSRVHLDIETDDINAEVTRLEALGAKQIERMERWVVMEAPTGQRFCVVRQCTDDFAASANSW